MVDFKISYITSLIEALEKFHIFKFFILTDFFLTPWSIQLSDCESIVCIHREKRDICLYFSHVFLIKSFLLCEFY